MNQKSSLSNSTFSVHKALTIYMSQDCIFDVVSDFNGRLFFSFSVSDICSAVQKKRTHDANPYYMNAEGLPISQYELRSQTQYVIRYKNEGRDFEFSSWYFEYHKHGDEALKYVPNSDWNGNAWLNSIREYGLINGEVLDE